MYLKKLVYLFEKNRNTGQAKPMAEYMKLHFPFLGIKTPERKVLLRQFFNETGILKEKELPITFLKDIWVLPEREYHYAVLTVLAAKPEWLEEKHLPFLEELITTQSWWDTVDTLASNIVGPFFIRHPGLEEEAAEKWKSHENMWLRRTAILYQLKYKERTNQERLFHIIRLNSRDKEFFIKKAIGWALREYSKTNPRPVASFIDNEKLEPLSKREGMKHIYRQKKQER
ncbi:DNA alkylation repair protein [Salipaludibacillus sp. CUR1]|uniref:DNA alkylation repair protein n=1 Tax=Salipaludibacillus sp. CUR1 TaxID=2820003 RepID=UPI001E2D5FBE|nr:DNA alkylation repair protein [Salipaludibacillus sp. CUR1]